MRKRYCHSGTGGMVSSSSLFLVSRALLQMFMISLLLYDGSVWCAIVGNGKHEMENEKITKLKMGTPTKCKIQQTADGFELLYDKDETAKEACTLDLFVKKIDTFIMMKVGVRAKSGTLTSCLTGDKNLEDRVNDNILPFSFSLHESSEFTPSQGGDADCNHMAQCKNNGGHCLSEAHYSVGFGRNGNKVTTYISPIGDTQLWSCDYPEKSADANDAHIEFKVRTDGQPGWEVNGECKDDLAFGKKSPNCVIPKKLQQAKKWEIKDKSLPDPIFDHLFTLHVFKQQRVPKHKKGPGLGEDLTGGQTPKCQLYIHFDGKYFKQLGGTAPSPPIVPGQTGPVPSNSEATDPPLGSEGPAAESSNIGLIIGIVAVVVVLLLVVGGAVWFFALRGKGGEEAGMEMGMTAGAGGTTKTKATKAGTTVGATQAKTGMTTVGGTQAKTGMTTAGGATKGATSKAAGTTKGGATSKAGATSKK